MKNGLRIENNVKEDCPYCFGSGIDNSININNDVCIPICECCNGTGKVNQTHTIEYVPIAEYNKLKDAFEKMKKGYFAALVCSDDLSLSQEDYFYEMWDKKAGLNLNK